MRSVWPIGRPTRVPLDRDRCLPDPPRPTPAAWPSSKRPTGVPLPFDSVAVAPEGTDRHDRSVVADHPPADWGRVPGARRAPPGAMTPVDSESCAGAPSPTGRMWERTAAVPAGQPTVPAAAARLPSRPARFRHGEGPRSEPRGRSNDRWPANARTAEGSPRRNSRRPLPRIFNRDDRVRRAFRTLHSGRSGPK